MKAIDVSVDTPTLTEVLDIAGEENVILRTADGRHYVLAEIDDFAEEVAKVNQNAALRQLLTERSKEPGQFTLTQVREHLGGNKKQSKIRSRARGGR